MTSREHSRIFSHGTLKLNVSLKIGLSVHLKMGVLRFSIRLSPNWSHTLTYGSANNNHTSEWNACCRHHSVCTNFKLFTHRVSLSLQSIFRWIILKLIRTKYVPFREVWLYEFLNISDEWFTYCVDYSCQCHLFAFMNCAWWQLSLCFMYCYDM